MLIIIFSKDRPMQLDLLLRSMERYVHGNKQAIAITLGDCYDKVFQEHTWCSQMKQTSFHKDLIQSLSYLHHRHVMFLVDDTVFVDDVYLKEIDKRMVQHNAITYSLRLGRNVNYCYMLDEEQKLTNGNDHGDYISFNWKHQEYDWAYPMDVSSSVFNLTAMYQLTHQLPSVANPNQFENYLARAVTPTTAKRSIMLCNKQSAAYSIPLNMTQTEYTGNRHANTYSIEQLLTLWGKNHRIDIDKIPRIPNGVHMVVQIEFTKEPIETKLCDEL